MKGGISMQLLYWLENMRTPFLDQLMALVTRLGEEMIFMVVAIVVFWCIRKTYGYYLLTVGFLGTMMNQFMKLLFRVPRPWVLDPDFQIVESAREAATGYSFPSGHTQNAVGTFGGIARFTQKKWVRILCIVALLAVSFSRMYLGVHTPWDVGVSFLIGTILVVALYPLIRKIEENPTCLLWLLGGMIVCSGVYLAFTYAFPFPEDIDMANLQSGISNGWKLLGATIGMLAACWLDQKYIHFETKAVWWVQILKVVLGLLVLLVIKSGLKAPLIALCGHAGVAGTIRYALVVLFAGAIWPMTFRWFAKLGSGK